MLQFLKVGEKTKTEVMKKSEDPLDQQVCIISIFTA